MIASVWKDMGRRFAAGRGEEVAGRRNMLLLIQLRWIAVIGQAVTIAVVALGFGVELPLSAMLSVLFALTLFNILSPFVLRGQRAGNRELFLAMLVDVAALSVQLYLSGGAANPFISLYLLQVVLAALLLETWSSWAMVAVSVGLFGLVALTAPVLDLPPALEIRLSWYHLLAFWGNFVLSAVLLVLFITRVNRNLRSRDAYLAEMRQREAEEDHIVRMGLLASGAAHELGTPLSSIAVILADWKAEPAVAQDGRLSEELGEMQFAVARCKDIVRGILLASGEVLGDAPAPTSVRTFIEQVVSSWSAVHPGMLFFDDRLGEDQPIIADRALAQVIANVLDNALEAGAERIVLRAECRGDSMLLRLEDDGSGFPVEMLDQLGKPYQSSKGKRGGGLGLFLAVNVLRKLGGAVSAHNREAGGAVVTLRIPLESLGGRNGG